MDWTAEQVVTGYDGQQQVERVFRGLKDGEWHRLGTDASLDRPQDPHPCVLLHAGHLSVAVLQYVHRQAKAAWSDLSMEQLLEELQQIQQFVLLYRSTHGKARKVPLALPMCSRSKLWRSRLWPRH